MSIFTGSADDDIFTGGADVDTASGGGGADVLSGGGGDDVLFSDAAQPYFTRYTYVTVADTGTAVDTLTGGEGDDIISVGYGDNADGGANYAYGDNLIVSFLGASSGVTADFSQSTLVIGGGTITGFEGLIWVQGSNFDDNINLGIYSTYAPGTQAYGMGGNDTLVTGYYTSEMYGGDGDDIVDGRNGIYLLRLEGGAGDDTIYTPSTSVTAYGDDGDDTIYAHSGAFGGSGNDLIVAQQSYYSGWLLGEAGDDQIQSSGARASGAGGAGADILTGDFYDDVLYSGDAPSAGITDPHDMGLEHDQLFGMDGDDTLSAGYGDDVDGGNGTDSLRLSLGGLTSGVTFDTAGLVSGQPFVLGGGTIQHMEKLVALRGSEFADTLTLATQAELLTVDGGAGDDVITSSNSSASVLGGAGDDRFVSGKAGDTFDGGDGSDTIDYSGYTTAVSVSLLAGVGPNGDTFANVENIIGGGGDDTLTGTDGDNSLAGGAGVDTVSYASAAAGVTVDIGLSGVQQTFGSGYDTLSGFENLIGSAFNDRLGGNGLANVLTGGAGADVLVGRGGADTLAGGAGTDTADYSGAAGGVNVSLAAQAASNDGDGSSDTLSSIENVTGSAFADTIVGDDGVNVLVAGAGADTLTGGGGADVFKYLAISDSTTSAYDTITDFQTGVDRIDLTALQPAAVGVLYAAGVTYLTLPGGALKIVVPGEVKVADILVGAATGFTIVGDDSSHALAGGAGADILIGGGGGDGLTGGAGPDTFRYLATTDSKPDAYDVIADFQTKSDVIDLKGVTPTEVSLVRSGAATFVFVNTPGGPMTIAANGDVNGADVLTHDGHGSYMIGDGGANTLIGGATGDVIQAGDGNDIIIGGGGGDVIFGQAGADTIKYLAASDSNASGPDGIYVFETGVDKIDLSAVAPTEVSLIRGGGSTFLFANTPTGAMQLATVGYDLNANDLITGMSRGIFMIGDETANTLIGGSLNDVIQAGAGDDVVRGGGGGDALWGGAGADVFKYTAASDSTARATDSIFDFQSGVDKLDLTGVRTGASDVYGVLSSGGSTFVFVDLHGDGVGDMTVQLTNTASLQAGDILF